MPSLSDEGHRIHEELTAILDEHLPAETVKVLLAKIDDLTFNHFAVEDHNQRRIYRALLGFIPGFQQEVRAAFQPIVFDGSRCNERDWLKWERGIEWPITPDYHDLLMNGREGGPTCS
jgi:hypothetical protein